MLNEYIWIKEMFKKPSLYIMLNEYIWIKEMFNFIYCLMWNDK